MSSDKVTTFLDSLREEVPDESQTRVLDFEDLWERKLWHQLTDALIDYFSLPESANYRIAIFKTFVDSFASKINQLKYTKLGLMASTQCPDNERLAFLSGLVEKVNKPDSQDAYVFALAEAAAQKLRLKDFDGAQKDLATAQSVLDTFDSVETIVHAAFYKVNSDYYQSKLDFATFYKNALLYLACVDIEDIPKEERTQRAYDLSIAALVSDSIYNFGELLLHPILDSLRDTDHQWLRDLLFAFNKGDLVAYDSLVGNLTKDSLLSQNSSFLYEKISLAALTEAAFCRPSNDRSMTFEYIRLQTKVQPDQVEHIIMKALSLGLLKGSIDQIAQVAHITWVQPKVLDMNQIDQMRVRLQEWDSGVNQLGHWIEKAGQDVWAA
ncbi:26S proteasome non-ATPase regulatory subunit 13 [Ascosphaera apis ARSEF 7405]|uniref:26S proteasome non-ATPase regulatory subunit 13 n=1 Tax=Ascosphaera apis ARSEF 7405 TaxID=392613 RepID=A0A168CU30_9EURO|nr:26S proteasome non-ATPase regulatory subunit 13 [Ascosphaera apis ARSEF 7405]